MLGSEHRGDCHFGLNGLDKLPREEVEILFSAIKNAGFIICFFDRVFMEAVLFYLSEVGRIYYRIKWTAPW